MKGGCFLTSVIQSAEAAMSIDTCASWWCLPPVLYGRVVRVEVRSSARCVGLTKADHWPQC
jgi:hypothetical protein